MHRGHLRLHARRSAGDRATERAATSPLREGQSSEGQTLVDQLDAHRELGLYISGLPGVGKSTLLLHLILDDIRAGRACCVLDPHSDLIGAILARSPSDDATLR